MISFLRGNIKDVINNKATIEVGGIGYEVRCTERECSKLSKQVGQEVEIYTHYYLREDTAELYGFLDKKGKDMFVILIGISGIGPKGALNILNTAPLDILQRAIAEGDNSVLTKVSGIGSKIAQKIILELKNKFEGEWLSGDIRTDSDVIEALEGLGYSKSQIHEVFKKISETVKSTEEKLKEALKILGGLTK